MPATKGRIWTFDWTWAFPACNRWLGYGIKWAADLRGRLLAATVGVLLLQGSVAVAATRALVVGVSGYPALAESLRLVGPKNDSREFANTLARLGVPASDITVLADGVSGLADGISLQGPGTKQAILDGLDRLAETSQPGDLAVFYFSGHGSQQADLDGDEQGGADEIFLPYDVGKWTGAGVENAIVDDELNQRIKRILDKGVDFFGVIDACHSATGFRAITGEDVRSRRVDPSDLGVPSLEASAGRGLGQATETAAAGGRGRATFFYAAQESEEALEKAPKDAENGESFGVFTYTMLRRLNQTQGLTYRTLHQAVVSDIKRNTLAATQTPELEGELLDDPVLRLSVTTANRQWPIFAGKLQAGQLSGLSTGGIVALYDDPSASDDAPIAHGIIKEAGATKSIVLPTMFPCADQGADGQCATPADEAAFKKGRFARLVEAGVDLSVTLSEPVRIDPDDGHDYSVAIAALRAAVAADGLSKRVSLRDKGFDIAVGLVDGKLAFTPAGGPVDRNGVGSSPRLTLPEDPQAAAMTVGDAIGRMTKVLALQRLGGTADDGSVLGFEPVVRIARAKEASVQDGACAEGESGHETAVEVGDAPLIRACDIVSVEMKNSGRKPLDVTVLLVGRDFSITTLWPLDGSSNRIDPSQSKTADLIQLIPDGEPASDQRLVFVAVPGVGKSHTVFDNLEQDGLRAVPGEDAGAAGARELLAAGLGDMTRSTVAQPAKIEEDMAIAIRPLVIGSD